jgi:glycosyltransferase involved in cell wall biosynthesis
MTGRMRDHQRRRLPLQWPHLDCGDEPIDPLNTGITRGLQSLRASEPQVPAVEARQAGWNAGAPCTSAGPLPFARTVIERVVMKLSVIIPCLNASSTIAVQLEALANQSWSAPWEVIISDNGSTDESRTVVERYKDRLPNLRIVDASDRQGAAHARNVGALVATGEALAFCDADDEIAPGWVAAIGESLSKYDFVASRFDFEKLNPLARHKRKSQRDGLPKIWYPPYLSHAGGCGLGVKRSVHESVGGFDESLPVLEDTDYCFRIQLAGVEFYFVPDAVVYVRQRDKLRGLYRQARLWAEYNIFLYKRYRRPGMEVSQPWKQHLREWKRLIRRSPQLLHKESRGGWVRRLGWQIGRLKGSIKYLVPPV